jgi:hypothetical protein
MANKEIKDYVQVVTPALTDVFPCQQGGTTYKQTSDQILSNVAIMTAASALDGTEVTLVRQSGVNKKVTTAVLAAYIIGQV